MLATSTAALFGVGDFLGGLASRRDSAIAVTAVAHAVGVAVFAVLLLVFPAPFTSAGFTSGIAAGVFGGVGVAALFAALARGRMSVVAPLTAALSGSLPAVYDFIRGERLPVTALVGLGLALVATVIVSATAQPDEEGAAALPTSALVLSIVSGFGFAGAFISFSFAPADSGFWPLMAARLVSFAMLASVTLVRRRTLAIEQTARTPALSSGALDAVANITMLWSIRIGPLSVASVIGSLYPVITVLLARVILKEHLHGLQRLGVVMALAAVLLTAVR